MPGLNARGLEGLDLRSLKPDGKPWNFARPKGRAGALRLLRGQKPRWVIAASPCTSFSVPNRNLTFRRMSEQEVKATMPPVSFPFWRGPDDYDNPKPKPPSNKKSGKGDQLGNDGQGEGDASAKDPVDGDAPTN